jgi:CBS domain-containing protein
MWVLWVLVAVLVGLVTAFVVARIYEATGNLIWVLLVPPLVVGVVGGVIQEIVLRLYLADLGRGEWTIATALGIIFGWFASLPLVVLVPAMLLSLLEPPPPLWTELVFRVLGAGAVGVVAGIAQWQLLRHYVRSDTYGPKSSLIWVASSGVAWLLSEFVRIITVSYSVGFFPTPTANQAANAEGWVFSILVVGIVTGTALIWLLWSRPLVKVRSFPTFDLRT